MTFPTTPPPPSGKRLAVASLIALGVASLVLVLAVLPAEFGIDPTGAGKALGLLDLYTGATEDVGAPPPPVAGDAPRAKPTVYKTESTTFTLQAGQGFEYKYRMDEGLGMVYAWDATGKVKYEFHSDPETSSKQVISHDKAEGTHGAGSLIAPYSGIHGWYWENVSGGEVTIALTSAGFYQSGDEMWPKWDPEKHKNRIEHRPHELKDLPVR